MRYGPNTAAVEAFLAALADPAVRSRGAGRPVDPAQRGGPTLAQRHPLELFAFHAHRHHAFIHADVDARSAAASSQSYDASMIAAALVVADVIDEATWVWATGTPLAGFVHLKRPVSSLTDQCACGATLGERFLAAAQRDEMTPGTGPSDCGHPVKSLPSDALEIALGLVPEWTGDWLEIPTVANRLAGHRERA